MSSTSATPIPSARIASIDALRGVVMLLMLVDHSREFFYLHAQVRDPMDLATTPPELFFTRLLAHLCAPVFVLLTGLAAALYGDARGGRGAAAGFLLKRGLFLIVLEWTVVNFAWTFDPTPSVIYLQVIWAIGLSMVALAALLYLPRPALIGIGVLLAFGHNLLDGIAAPPGGPGHVLWSVLHERGFIELPGGARARTSYPVLPWVGVIALGYALGPWFARQVAPVARQRRLAATGAGALLLFALLRALNGYGEPVPWQVQGDALTTAMRLLNLTKYPPSADFLLLTLGIGLLLLAALERWGGGLVRMLAVFGAAPLFFYLLHLYLLHAINRVAGLATHSGPALVSVPNVASLWLLAGAVAVPCWFLCRRFAAVKRRSGAAWMRYL
ncbi:DUF1624 domain-containing protein [Sphingomonas hengshuiensis]|nr:heparan-alpha-glucosaminide N-acetyltransferase domain-containing protein [Sphingomonas hengshuiensis]